MTTASASYPTLLPDPLATLAPHGVQLQAARLVQESFAAVFRLSVEASLEQRQASTARLASHLLAWSRMATREAAQVRMALILTGLDQWGVAFSQAFGAAALGGLSVLVEALRQHLDAAEEETCQRHFVMVQSDEAAAFQFKVELRRELHLALWHAMIAAENRDDAMAILTQIGGMMLALIKLMPTQGWRLVADALASIQIRCLSHGLAIEGLARETTEELFAALYRELPEAVREAIVSQSTQSVVTWQQARRATQH